jgi:hypothetical protein
MIGGIRLGIGVWISRRDSTVLWLPFKLTSNERYWHLRVIIWERYSNCDASHGSTLIRPPRSLLFQPPGTSPVESNSGMVEIKCGGEGQVSEWRPTKLRLRQTKDEARPSYRYDWNRQSFFHLQLDSFNLQAARHVRKVSEVSKIRGCKFHYFPCYPPPHLSEVSSRATSHLQHLNNLK